MAENGCFQNSLTNTCKNEAGKPVFSRGFRGYRRNEVSPFRALSLNGFLVTVYLLYLKNRIDLLWDLAYSFIFFLKCKLRKSTQFFLSELFFYGISGIVLNNGDNFFVSNEKVYKMELPKIYPLLVNKAVKKGRTQEEVDEIIRWLTGYRQTDLEAMLGTRITYEEFFRNAPELNENRKLIRGVVCGVRVENIEEPLMREIRYLDKLVDELAKGKSMEKILRK